jgi:hypothetical protein
MKGLVLEKKITKLVLFLDEGNNNEYPLYEKHQIKKNTHILFLVQETANIALSTIFIYIPVPAK